MHRCEHSREDAPLLASELSQHDHPTRAANFVRIAVGVSFLAFVSGLEVTMIAAIGPAIGHHFGTESLSLLLGTVFLLFSTLSTSISARSSNVFGRRSTITIACGIYTAGISICSFSPSIAWILIGRSISGFGMGGISVLISVILSDTVPLKSRALWHSIGKGITGIAMSVGGPLGGLMADHSTWRTTFYALIPLGLATMIMAMCMIHDKEATLQTLKYPDLTSRFFALDVVGYTFLTLALISGFICLSGSSPILALSETASLSFGLVCGLAVMGLCYTSITTNDSIIAIRLFRSKNVSSIILMIFTSSLIHQSILYNIPLFAVSVSRVSAAAGGAFIMPVSLAAVLATLLAGLQISRTGKCKRMMLIGSVSAMLGPVIFIIISFSSPKAPFDMLMEIMGSFPSTFGAQVINAVSLVALLASCETRDIADLTGLTTLFKSLGGAVGTALSAVAMESLLSTCRTQEQLKTNILMEFAKESIHKGTIHSESSPIGLHCWKYSFGGMFAIIAMFSLINVGLVCWGVDELSVVRE